MWLSSSRTRLVPVWTWVSSLASLSGSGSGVAVSCGVGCRHGLDPTLLGLWCRLAAVALTQPLAWESPCQECSPEKTKDKINK